MDNYQGLLPATFAGCLLSSSYFSQARHRRRATPPSLWSETRSVFRVDLKLQVLPAGSKARSHKPLPYGWNSRYRACHFPVLAYRNILTPQRSMESREPPLGAMSGRRYSAAQIYLIRQRLRAYYEMKKAQVGPSFNWNSVAELLHLVIEEIEGTEETELRIKGERLRQIATGQISRGAPSGTTDENLDLIVRFLTHPDIGSLTLEDLNEPDLPYQFALQLMEFLRHDEHSDLALPPGNLKGRYRAVVRSGGEISDIRVDIIISRDGNLVHVNEIGRHIRRHGR